jgi:AraC-like DNA-binding protein
MTRKESAMKDYFVYLPNRDDQSIWGCVATGAGYTRVPAGSPYPLRRHPLDHHFTWGRGRTLHSFQIIFISEGKGVFESRRTKATEIDAGTVLILFPGAWHRYAPDPATGWVEHWIECGGAAFEKAVRSEIIRPQQAVLRTGLDADMLHCFDRIHTLSQSDALANQDKLSTLGLHLLSVLAGLQRRERGFEAASDQMVQRSLAMIALRCHEAINLPALARELGVGYSRFRQAFKARVGISPKQHHLDVRIQKTKELLANTNKPVKEIADILGFESAFHLARQFKLRTGKSPTQWRARHSR